MTPAQARALGEGVALVDLAAIDAPTVLRQADLSCEASRRRAEFSAEMLLVETFSERDVLERAFNVGHAAVYGPAVAAILAAAGMVSL